MVGHQVRAMDSTRCEQDATVRPQQFVAHHEHHRADQRSGKRPRIAGSSCTEHARWLRCKSIWSRRSRHNKQKEIRLHGCIGGQVPRLLCHGQQERRSSAGHIASTELGTKPPTDLVAPLRHTSRQSTLTNRSSTLAHLWLPFKDTVGM